MLLLCTNQELRQLKQAMPSTYLNSEVARGSITGLPESLIVQGSGHEVFANLPTDAKTEVSMVRLAIRIIWGQLTGPLDIDNQNLIKLGKLCKSWGASSLIEEILKRLDKQNEHSIGAFRYSLGDTLTPIKEFEHSFSDLNSCLHFQFQC